jgi:hypothetical protein
MLRGDGWHGRLRLDRFGLGRFGLRWFGFDARAGHRHVREDI